MTAGDHYGIEAQKVFLAAIEWESAEQRDAYLDGVYRDDPGLREPVTELFEDYASSGELPLFASSEAPTLHDEAVEAVEPALSSAPEGTAPSDSRSFVPGTVLDGRYRIV